MEEWMDERKEQDGSSGSACSAVLFSQDCGDPGEQRASRQPARHLQTPEQEKLCSMVPTAQEDNSIFPYF